MKILKIIISLFLFLASPLISMQEPMVIENPMTVEQPTIKIQFKDTEVDYPVADYAKVVRQSLTLQDALAPEEIINFTTISDADLTKRILALKEIGIPEITVGTFKAIQKVITTNQVTEFDSQKLCDLINATNFLDIESVRNKAVQSLAIKAFGGDLKEILNAEFFKTYCVYSLPPDLQRIVINHYWKGPNIVKNFYFKDKEEVTDIALSPDHSYFVVHFRGTLDTIIYDIITAQKFYLKYAGAVTHLAISPDNLTIATSSYDDQTFSGSIKLWDVKTQKIIAEKKFENQMPGIIKFTPDGKQIAVKLALSNIIEFYKVSDFPNEISFRREFKFARWILSNFALAQDPHNPDNYYILISEGKNVYLYSTYNEEPLFTDEYSSRIITDIALSLDGKILITGNRGGAIQIWVEGQRNKTLNMKSVINSIALGSNRDYLVIAAGNSLYFTLLEETIKIYESGIRKIDISWILPGAIQIGKPLLEYAVPIQKIDISSDNQYLLIATEYQIQIRYLDRIVTSNFINNLSFAEAQVWKLKTQYNLTEQQIPKHLKSVYESLQEKIKKFKAESLGQQ